MRFRNPTRVAGFLTVAMLLMVACAIGAANFQRRGVDKNGATAKRVSEMVSEQHINRPAIDDALGAKVFDRYIDSLDPQKLYFTKSDITKLSRFKSTIDDNIRAGKVEFAFQVFDLYKTRMNSRIATAEKFIDAEHNFTIDEELLIDTDDLDWGDDATITDRWRKRVKYELLSLKLEDMIADKEDKDAKQDEDPMPEIRTRLHKRYHNLKSVLQQTERGEILEIYLGSMTHALDPHSTYMSPDTLQDFQIAMELKLEGIGASLRSEDGYTIVAAIVANGAAEADGRLEVDDKIIAVDERASRGNDKWIDVVEMKLKHVVRHIRGPKGTRVRLRVKKPSGAVEVYELARKLVKLEDAEVKGEIINTGDRLNGRKGRIGVINIPSFYRDFRAANFGGNFKSTRRDVEKVLRDFKRQGGVDAVVVDLRMNGGGALQEAIEVTGLFISQGPVVQVQQQNGRPEIHKDDDSDIACREPVIVLCNRLSASASEIFAGAIKDYKRGIVVGDTTTHGKGTVQNVLNVVAGSGLSRSFAGALKLTINKFYRVNGDSTQNRGVTSDIVLPSILDHREIGESTLDNALAFDRIGGASYSALRGYVTPKMVSMMQQKSAARVAADEEFSELNEDIAKFEKRKNRKTISLNEDTLRQELADAKREADEAKKDAEKQAQAGGKKDEPIFPAEFYNDEVLEIALDYLDLWRAQKTAAR